MLMIWNIAQGVPLNPQKKATHLLKNGKKPICWQAILLYLFELIFWVDALILFRPGFFYNLTL